VKNKVAKWQGQLQIPALFATTYKAKGPFGSFT